MANNRMYLKHKPSGKRILLAKYYPSTGWNAAQNAADLTLAFTAIQFGPDSEDVGSMWGTDWELEYEIPPEPLDLGPEQKQI